MRDRLIELIKEYICSLHIGDGAAYFLSGGVPDLADHLLANGVIVPPCKVGQTVYIIDEGDGEFTEDYVLDVKVSQINICENGIGIELVLPIGMRICQWLAIGKNLFLTKEEAEKALKGGEG